MPVCVMCNTERSKAAFLPGNPICNTCYNRMGGDYESAEYSAPEQVTIHQAHVNLILAIRKQAEDDGELGDWEEYWLHDPDWQHIWMLFHIS